MMKRIIIMTTVSIFIFSLSVGAQKTTTTTTRGGLTTTFGRVTTTTAGTTTTTAGPATTTTTIPQPAGPSQFTQPLPNAPVSAGSILNAHGSDPSLNDIKGQPVIGFSTGGGITGYWGAGYHLWVGVGPGDYVPLTIERQGDDIKISWSTGTQPDIYCAVYTAPATGQYVNEGTDWTDITDGSISDQFDLFNVSSGYILHNDQASGSSASYGEVYYKALKPGTDPTAVNPDTNQTYLFSAEAVGKIDISVDPGYNLVSVPFTYEGVAGLLKNVFGDQLHAGNVDTADRIYTKGDSGSWGMDNAYLSNDGKWYWSNQPAIESTISVGSTKGYLVRNKGSQVLITVVGDVSGPQTIDMTQGFNAVGTVHPVNIALNSLGISGLANVTAGDVATADRLYIKEDAGSWGMSNAYLASDGNWYWSNQPSVLADFTFHAPLGYYYRMRGLGNILWLRELP
ncbi:MAG: hypothetical protein U9R38_06840 [Candidatus Margulisiibacteriota bacterium]|nr:hypothetical protein [Candidatus Margulisiibacteriota bacterium]